MHSWCLVTKHEVVIPPRKSWDLQVSSRGPHDVYTEADNYHNNKRVLEHMHNPRICCCVLYCVHKTYIQDDMNINCSYVYATLVEIILTSHKAELFSIVPNSAHRDAHIYLIFWKSRRSFKKSVTSVIIRSLVDTVPEPS